MSSLAQSRLAWLACGAAGGAALGAALQRLLVRYRSKAERIAGVDFRGRASAYVRAPEKGMVAMLGYDVAESLTPREYDEWLFGVHYHDLLANPHLDRLVLRTVNKNVVARLSSGAAVENSCEFSRLAELHFGGYGAYSRYIEWFQANAIPPPRTPAGRSAFKFYLLSEGLTVERPAGAAAERPAEAAPVPCNVPQLRGGPLPRGAGPTVLVVGSTGNIGTELVRLLRLGGATVLGAGRGEVDRGVAHLDVYDAESVRGLDRALSEQQVDHVVVVCGASIFGPVEKLSAEEWERNCNKLVAIGRLIVMLANGTEVRCLKAGGSITVTTGQAARTVNKMWPGIAANNAGLEAMVRCAGVDPPRGVRINAVAPALVRETAEKAGLPLENTVPAADVAAAYVPLIFGDASGQVVDVGSQAVFVKSHHAAQKDGIEKR